MIEAVIEKLLLMRLFGMAEGLREQNDAYRDLSFEERFGLLVDKERLYRENSQIKTLLSHAHLRHPNACFEDIDFRTRRGLSKDTMLKFAQNEWIRNHQNVIIIGPTGAGKTYLACALANGAIRQGTRTPLCEAATVGPGTDDREGGWELRQVPRTDPEDETAHY